ncbi:hypothetical protein TPAU25S_00903 [Tsukamurella paurometabola]
MRPVPGLQRPGPGRARRLVPGPDSRHRRRRYGTTVRRPALHQPSVRPGLGPAAQGRDRRGVQAVGREPGVVEPFRAGQRDCSSARSKVSGVAGAPSSSSSGWLQAPRPRGRRRGHGPVRGPPARAAGRTDQVLHGDPPACGCRLHHRPPTAPPSLRSARYSAPVAGSPTTSHAVSGSRSRPVTAHPRASSPARTAPAISAIAAGCSVARSTPRRPGVHQPVRPYGVTAGQDEPRRRPGGEHPPPAARDRRPRRPG